jgi:hypothetical protein
VGRGADRICYLPGSRDAAGRVQYMYMQRPTETEILRQDIFLLISGPFLGPIYSNDCETIKPRNNNLKRPAFVAAISKSP